MAFLNALITKARRTGSKEKAEAGGCLSGSVPSQVSVPERRTRSVALVSENLARASSWCGQPVSQKQPGCIGVPQPQLSGTGGPLLDISNNLASHHPKVAATNIPPFVCPQAEDSEAAAEYVPDMLGQLFSNQFAHMADPEYMQTQVDLNNRMRAVLVDWLIEVHADYKMKPETLFLAVSLIDRYLSRKSVPRSKLQLIGVIALLVAAKFEEVYPPKVDNLVYITDDAYSKAEIMRVECTFLATLGFEVMGPTCDHFFDHFQRLIGCDAFQLELARYLLELSLLDTSVLRYEPSRVAAASILLANELLGRSPVWPKNMAAATRHSALSLADIVGELRALLEASPASSLQAAHKKYSKDQHLAVATAFPRAR